MKNIARLVTPRERFNEILDRLRREHPLIAKMYEVALVARCDRECVHIRIPAMLAGGGILGDRSINRIRSSIDLHFETSDVPFEISITYGQDSTNRI